MELSREERLGPGGLDPVEVFETLQSRCRRPLNERHADAASCVGGVTEPEEAKRHMDACEASGLWVQNNASEEATVADDRLA